VRLLDIFVFTIVGYLVYALKYFKIIGFQICFAFLSYIMKDILELRREHLS